MPTWTWPRSTAFAASASGGSSPRRARGSSPLGSPRFERLQASCGRRSHLPRARAGVAREIYVGLTLRVDGVAHELPDQYADQSLLRVLRDELGVIAAKNACEEGECGSCTVLVAGE